MSMGNPDLERNYLQVRSKLKIVLPKRKRARILKERFGNKVSDLKIVKQTNEGMQVNAVFHYKNSDKPLRFSMWIPFPNPTRTFQRIKNENPTWTNAQCKKATRIYLKRYVQNQLKSYWKKNKPVQESLNLEEEIDMGN